MSNKKLNLLAFLAGASIILSGCATPMVPREVMSTVTQPPTAFREIQQNTDHYIGITVLWGGQILGVMNSKDSTSIQILQEPVDSDGKPTDRDASQGRFLAECKDYLDAEVYAPGRRITIVGKIKGKIAHPLAEGQSEYDYPVVSIENVYLWQKEPRVYPAPYPYYYGPPLWWGPYWGPYWGVEWDMEFRLGHEGFRRPGPRRQEHSH
jgi:outer membrane lipoprotein